MKPGRSGALRKWALIVLAAGLGCAAPARAAAPAVAPPAARSVMDFVGTWPPDEVGTGVPLANHRREVREALRPEARAGGDGADCLQWALGRIDALWHTTLDTVKVAWFRAREALFGARR